MSNFFQNSKCQKLLNRFSFDRVTKKIIAFLKNGDRMYKSIICIKIAHANFEYFSGFLGDRYSFILIV